MSINGVGANGNGPQKIDPKQVEQKKTLSSAIKGFAEGTIGKLLGGNKAEAEDKPIKGLSIEHTGTIEYTGGPVEYQANGNVGYTANGTVDYNVSGSTGYTANGTVDYNVSGSTGYTASGTV